MKYCPTCFPLYVHKLPCWSGSQISAVSGCVSIFKLSETHKNCVSWVAKLTQALLVWQKIKPLESLNLYTLERLNITDRYRKGEPPSPLSSPFPPFTCWNTYQGHITEFLWINVWISIPKADTDFRCTDNFKRANSETLKYAGQSGSHFWNWTTWNSDISTAPQIISSYFCNNNFHHSWWLDDLMPMMSIRHNHRRLLCSWKIISTTALKRETQILKLRKKPNLSFQKITCCKFCREEEWACNWYAGCWRSVQDKG